jgi:hypothetical protein
MNCESAGKLIPLYFYGELAPDEEDRVEQHLHECAACARELDRQRSLAAAFDDRTFEPPPHLLSNCRADLMAAIQGGAPHLPAVRKGPWTLFLEAVGVSLDSVRHVPTPVGALALIALGFFCARFTGAWSTNLPGMTSAGMTPSDDVYATVRSVRPDPNGTVQIAFDETRRRTVSGRLDDSAIQRLLLAGAHEDNASVRVQSMDILKSQPQTNEVRDALLNAVAHDPNDAVRLKALDGLKPLAGDPEVRKTLSQVLLTDNNPAVRYQVVDVLVARHDDSVVGVLQRLIQSENNDPVLRLKIEKALKDMNASVGTF